MRGYSIFLSTAFVCFLAGPATADWFEFRGAGGASAVSSDLPIEFGGEEDQNVVWKVPFPGRAVNGPIIVDGQVITTSSSGNQQKRLHVVSVDDESGEVRWSRRIWATGRTLCHPLSAIAAPTPATDGQHIFAFFASNDLVALDLKGNVTWMRALGIDYPSAFDDRGLAASPCLVGDTLVVQIACSGDSFVFGLDKGTGETRWKVPLMKSTNWASPTRIRLDDIPMVMVQSADRLLLLDAATGDVRHEYEAEGNLIPSPLIANDTILLPADGMTALRFSPQQLNGEVLWKEEKVAASTASAAADAQHFYVVRAPNILTAASIEDGEVAWKKRLSGNGFWATPLLSKSHIYVPNTDGSIFVVRTDDGEIAAENDLGEEVLGSPAASNGAIYIRGVSHLFKVDRR